MTFQTANRGPDLEAIRPENGAKYSPNLYAWLTVKRQGRLTPRARLAGVHLAANAEPWIGYPRHDAGFIGQRLSHVLDEGAGAGIGAWRRLGQLQFVPGFWPRYVQVGRCAFDHAHTSLQMYAEHRWSRNGDTRRCRWCGIGSQVLVRWTEVEECQAWEAPPVGTQDGARLG